MVINGKEVKVNRENAIVRDFDKSVQFYKLLQLLVFLRLKNVISEKERHLHERDTLYRWNL